MKIAMMQPAFLPWQGFFELILKADLFIVLDDFQFSVQSHHQRNRLFVNKKQADWYTIPVKKTASFGGAISDMVIEDNTPWRIKMWKRIKQNYSKTPYFNETAPLVEEWLLSSNQCIAEFNMSFVFIMMRLLKIDTDIRLSSQFPSNKRRSDKILALLRWARASHYLCARGSFGYMKEDGIFPVNDIKVLFQNFTPKKYVQVGSPNEFIPFLSVLDAVFNIGPDQTRELINGGTPKWSTWEERCSSQIEPASGAKSWEISQ